MATVIPLLCLLACAHPTPEPSPAPPVDAADGAPAVVAPTPTAPPTAPTDPASLACSNMLSLGCQEGASPLCSAELRKVVEAGAGFSDPQLTCLSIAKSKQAVRSCGPFVACP